MSGTQVSSAPNVLFDPLMAGRQQAQQNQLMQQQQELTDHDVAMTGQAAAPLLNMSEEDAAAAYPGWLQDMQRQGLAKYAPPTYPGHAATQALVQRAIPLVQQYNLGIMVPPGLGAALQGNQPPAQGGQPPAQGSAPPGSGVTIGQRQNNPGNLTFAGQPGASPGQGNRFASFPDMPTGVAATADQLALYQTQHGINTVRGAVTRWVGDPKADLTGSGAGGTDVKPGSYIGDVAKALGVGPDDKIDLTDPAVQAKFIQAQFPHESAGGGYVLNPADVAKGVQMSAANRGRPMQAPGTAVAAVPPTGATPGGVAARTGGVDVAGPGAPPAAPAAPQFTYPNGKVGGAPDPTGLVRYNDGTAGTPPAGTPVPVAAATPATPVVAQGGQPPPSTPAAPGSAPPPAQPAQPSGPQANLPHASEVPSGQNSPQYQEWRRIQQQVSQLMPYAALPAAKAKIAQLQAQQQVLMQTDSVVNTQEGQLHTLTGKIDDPAKPLPHYVYSPDAGGPGIPGYIDTTGTNKPEINPARRMNVRPDGSVINDQGQVIAPAMPGATPPLGSFEVQKGDYEADRKLLPEIAAQGQNAQTAQVRLQTMLDLLPKISTGAGGYTRTQLANLAETAGFPGIAQTLIAHNSEGDAAAAQEFGKLTLAAAGAAERGDLGSRGSLGALKLYQQNNPSLDLRPGANKAMIGMQLIAAQADTDYSQAALAYANQHQNDFRTGKAPYQPLANFDLQWQQQKNPQVYAAAMGALNGQDANVWSKGLKDEDYNRALDIVARASPNAVVNTREGRKVMQPKATTPAPPPGFTVVQ